jgi:chorismate mutase
VNDAIKTLRERIDAIDQQLLELMNQRASFAREIGELKRRWADLPPRARSAGHRPPAVGQPGPLPADAIGHLFTELISACRALEQALSVAFLGRVERSAKKLRSNISVLRCDRARAHPSTRCFAKWKPDRPATAWCPWRTPPMAPSDARSTCCSQRRSRYAAKSCYRCTNAS